MRIIKRTKITVIRTETVFLKIQNGANAKEILKLQSAALLENEMPGSVLEIEAIKRTEDIEGELK